MGSYTMTLKEVLQMLTTDEATDEKMRIEKGRTQLFDFTYPFFDETYKPIFETHFIRTFYNREIGFETEGLFKFQLETWLTVNMPYYNRLFQSELLSFDPLSNTKLEISQSKTNETEQDSNSKVTGLSQSEGNLVDDDFSRHLESNTPDSRLKITTEDGKGVIEYASNIQENTANNHKTSESSSSGESESIASGNVFEVEDYVQNRLGKTGDVSFSKLLMEYRDSFLRIENRLFNEMNELFMLVY